MDPSEPRCPTQRRGQITPASTKHVHQDGASGAATPSWFTVEVIVTLGGNPVLPVRIESLEPAKHRLDSLVGERLTVRSEEDVRRPVAQPLPLGDVLHNAGFETRVRVDILAEAGEK